MRDALVTRLPAGGTAHRPPVRGPRRAVGRSRAGGDRRADQRGRPVLPRARRRLLLLRGADDQRRDPPPLPRPRLVDAGAPAAEGPARGDQRRGVELSQGLGRAPKPTEIAEHLGVPVSRCSRGWKPPRPTAARRWTRCSPPSRAAPRWASWWARRTPSSTGWTAARRCARSSPSWTSASARSCCCASSANMTQTQIAEKVGISQMHVSRLLAQTLDRLRNRMDPDTRVRLSPSGGLAP